MDLKIIYRVETDLNEIEEKDARTQIDDDNDHHSSKFIDILGEEYNFPPELVSLYYNLRTDVEMTIESFTLFSIESLKCMSRRYKECGQEDFLDVARSYGEGGFFRVLSWHKGIRKFFERSDGGQNSYEREETFKYYILNYGKDYEEIVREYDCENGGIISHKVQRHGFRIDEAVRTFDFDVSMFRDVE